MPTPEETPMTDSAAVPIVIHTGDFDDRIAAWGLGFDEAMRQRVGGVEHRKWAAGKIRAVLLNENIVPTPQLIERLLDELLSEADLTDDTTS